MRAASVPCPWRQEEEACERRQGDSAGTGCSTAEEHRVTPIKLNLSEDVGA